MALKCDRRLLLFFGCTYKVINLACSAGVFWVDETVVCVRIVVAAIFDFMTVEDWGE